MSRRRAGRKGSARSRAGERRSSPSTAERKRLRSLTFYTVAVAVLALAGYLLKPAIFGHDALTADASVIDVAIDMGGYDRPVIRIPAGEPVTLRLTSLDNRFHMDGGGRHQLAVDEMGVDIVAPPLGSASQTFTATEPGTYVFYCDVCCGGRANPTMSGKLVVEA